MNNLAYTSQSIDTIGPKVEEKIREELGVSTPVRYNVEDGAAGPTTIRTFLGDIGNAIVGGESNMLFNLDFELPAPRPARLQVSVDRQGVGSHVGFLLYTINLSKAVTGEVALEEPKTFGTSKFTGDEATAAMLNASKDLLKRVDKLARTESQSGGLTLKIKRVCKVVPQENGSMLIIGTLPRPTKMGLNATVDAKEFFEIAEMIEKAL